VVARCTTVTGGYTGGEDSAYNLELLHPNCHRQVHSQGGSVDQAASPVEEAFAKA
jgi:5-methylcytosine-specific restriction endonuclease McrA